MIIILLLTINIVVIVISLVIGFRVLSNLLVRNINLSERLIQLKLIHSLLETENDDLVRAAKEMKKLN